MAKDETLYINVDSNIKSVTKDQKEWTKEIKKTEGAIKNVNEEGKEVVAEMQILGLSINGLKTAWTSAASGAKFLFRSIKMGIAASGVGVLVLAFGTLATWFTTTKKGAEALSVAFKGIGSAIKVVVDRVSQFGSGLFKLLTGAKGGLKQMGDSFKGIGTEILTDTLNAMALEKALQKLVDRERELNVETAQRRAEIESLKMIAEDVTKSEKERLTAAEKAFKIEQDLLDKRVENAEEAVRLEKQRLNLITDPTAEQLDVLAQKEIDLANIQGESATKQIELNNKINAIKQETINKNLQLKTQADAELKTTKDMLRAIELLRIEDDHNREIRRIENERKDQLAAAKLIKNAEDREARINAINELFQEKYLALIEKNKTITIEGGEEEVMTAEEVAQRKKAVYQSMFNNITSMLQSSLDAQTTRLENDYNKEVEQAQANGKSIEGIENKYEGKRMQLAAKQKKLKIGLATIDMFSSVVAAYNQGMGVPPPAGLVLGPASAALALAAGLANINSIMQTDVGGGGGGGSVGGTGAETPSPQMMSGAFELTGGTEHQPIQAYVVSDDITQSQNGLEVIRRRATI